MTQKLSYVWILLVLAAAGCTPPLAPPPSALLENDDRNVDEPLSVVQQSDEERRLTLTRPVAWTQQEELVAKKDITTDLTPQEQQAHALMELKNEINTMKEQNKEALAEQRKEWEKQGKDIFDLDTEEILTHERQGHCMEHIIQQAQANIRLQNRILGTWGNDIVLMTWKMESFDSDAKP